MSEAPAVYAVQGTKYRLIEEEFDPDEEPLGKLLLWEAPKEECSYVIGVDTADGIGKDRTVVQVNRVGSKVRSDELVAEYCANLNPMMLAPILFAISRLYTIKGGEEPLMAIEINNGSGYAAQSELRNQYGYANLFVAKRYDKAKRLWTSTLGWTTNNTTRPAICARALQWIRQKKWRINSPWLVAELGVFEYDAAKAVMRAASNQHDDRVMAAFIALWASHDWSFEEQVANIYEEEVQEVKRSRNYQQMAISSADAERDEGFDGMLYYS